MDTERPSLPPELHSPETLPPRTLRAVVIGLTLLVFGLLFREVLFGTHLLAYRDALQYYHPLFERIQQEWGAGRIPLWNPYSNCGEPLLASPTAGVFYPVKLVFTLPLDYTTAYQIYILAHVLLAGGAMAAVWRWWGGGWTGAGVACLSYAFCGNVLMQYGNVVFLCGAAWLPFALWAGERMIALRSVRHAVMLAVVLALMVLGGDPQLAYEAGLLAAFYAIFDWWGGRQKKDGVTKESAPGATPATRWQQMGRSRLGLLACAATLAGLFSAVQVIPTIEFSSLSVRAASEVPRSIYEIPRFLQRRDELLNRPDTGRPPHWYDAILGDPPPPAKHDLQTYAFSLEPWRLVEFVWPNVTGTRFRDYCQWMRAIGWQGQTWVPSQYMGLFPLVMACLSLRFRRGSPRDRWLSWTVVLSLLASFGCYGPAWLLALVTGDADGVEMGRISGGVGGVYWFFTVFLPSFHQFRFPAKLMTLAAAGLSLLAAQGTDDWVEGRKPVSPRFWGTLVVVSATLLLASRLSQTWLLTFFEERSQGRFDALNEVGALWDIGRALLHTSVIAGACLLLTLACRREAPGIRRFAAPILLVVVAVDVGVASQPLVYAVRRDQWKDPTSLLHAMDESRTTDEANSQLRPIRYYRPHSWTQPGFLLDEGPPPLVETTQWQRQTMIYRQNLSHGVTQTLDHGSVTMNAYETWFDVLPIPEKNLVVKPRRAFDAWGTEYFLIPERGTSHDPERSTVGLETRWDRPEPGSFSAFVPLGDRLPVVSDEFASGAKLVANESAFPACWIAHIVRPIRPMEEWDRAQWLPLMSQLVFPFQNPVDLKSIAILEDEHLVEELGEQVHRWIPSEGAAEEVCRLVSYQADRVEVEATLASRGVVVLSDTYFPGWHVEVATDGGSYQSGDVLRTNRAMRGVLLQPGTHRVVFTYRPMSFWIGLAISLLAWVGLAAAVVWLLFRARVQRADGSA